MKSMVKITFFTAFALLVLFFLLYSAQSLFAQTTKSEEELKRELAKTEQEIKEQQAILNKQKEQSNAILGEVNVLTGQIRTVQKNIDAKNTNIKAIGQDISIKDQTVNQLNDKLDRSLLILEELIRATNKSDDLSIVEVLLVYDTISDFFEGIDSVVSIQASLDSLFDQVRQLRGLTEEEKIKLEEKKKREQDLKVQIEAEKNKVAVQQAQKQGELASSKATEEAYAKELAEKQAKAAAIRSALFKLRDATGISFEDALAYAQQASKRTGVRAAFILAILKQESDFGNNVGTCNRPGDPESKLWYNIMPGPDSGSWRDDQTIYKALMKELGRPLEGTPLSCPFGNGWGGAMGPTQFIPTTWKSYASRIASVAGVAVADPWNPEHAFIATSLYMADLGAGAQTYNAEFEAAGRYYAGSNWVTAGQGYAASVMNHTATYQKNIDFLNSVD